MKKKFEMLKQYPALLLFFLLLFGFTLVDLAYPDREYSELENTKLSQRPAFSLSALLRNEWTASYGNYVKDQIAFRDGWINLQSRSNSLIFQKCEFGGILQGSNDQLFSRVFCLTPQEQRQLPKNTQAVAQFAQRHPGLVTFLLAPSADVIYPEELPFHAPQIDENAYLDDIFAQTESAGASVLDLRTLFTEHKDEYLYYRTDHHWTSGGAYLAYTAYCNQQNLTPFDTAAHEAVEVPDFYGTHYSAARTWNAVPDTITYYPLDNPLTVYNITGENQFEVSSTGPLYDLDAFSTRDKYAAFLRGNNGYSIIEGSGTGSVLVIKDSYANSFVPFLTANYASITVIDLRNFNYGIDSLLMANQYDQVLILYNFQSFKSDTNIPRLNKDAIS